MYGFQYRLTLAVAAAPEALAALLMAVNALRENMIEGREIKYKLEGREKKKKNSKLLSSDKKTQIIYGLIS